MSKSTAFFAYSVGKKVVMAITGLFLVSFLIVHMSGNLQLFTQNPTAFNVYTRFMTTSPLIKISEIILVLGFVLHIFMAWRLTRLNAVARPEKYAYKKEGESSSWMSRNMGITGSIILIFLGIHLYMFWGTFHYGAGEQVAADVAFNESWKLTQPVTATINGAQVTFKANDYLTQEAATALGKTPVTALSMYKISSLSFKEWWIVLFYVAAMILLAFHLSHGFQSAFRSLGLIHKKYSPIVEKTGMAIAFLVPTLFGLMPLYHFLFV